jgi:hypothetical protein
MLNHDQLVLDEHADGHMTMRFGRAPAVYSHRHVREALVVSA